MCKCEHVSTSSGIKVSVDGVLGDIEVCDSCGGTVYGANPVGISTGGLAVDVRRYNIQRQVDGHMRGLVDIRNMVELKSLINSYYEGMESGEDVTDRAIGVLQGEALSRVIREHEAMQVSLRAYMERDAIVAWSREQ